MRQKLKFSEYTKHLCEIREDLLKQKVELERLREAVYSAEAANRLDQRKATGGPPKSKIIDPFADPTLRV